MPTPETPETAAPYRVVGVRLTPQDFAKLDKLRAATRRTSSDVIRRLIQIAEPSNAPLFCFPDPAQGEEIATAEPRHA